MREADVIDSEAHTAPLDSATHEIETQEAASESQPSRREKNLLSRAFSAVRTLFPSRQEPTPSSEEPHDTLEANLASYNHKHHAEDLRPAKKRKMVLDYLKNPSEEGVAELSKILTYDERERLFRLQNATEGFDQRRLSKLRRYSNRYFAKVDPRDPSQIQTLSDQTDALLLPEYEVLGSPLLESKTPAPGPPALADLDALMDLLSDVKTAKIRTVRRRQQQPGGRHRKK